MIRGSAHKQTSDTVAKREALAFLRLAVRDAYKLRRHHVQRSAVAVPSINQPSLWSVAAERADGQGRELVTNIFTGEAIAVERWLAVEIADAINTNPITTQGAQA